MIIYIFVNNRNRSSVKDFKVISGEKIVRKHCLLLIDIVFKKEAWRKVRFRKKIETVEVESDIGERRDCRRG